MNINTMYAQVRFLMHTTNVGYLNSCAHLSKTNASCTSAHAGLLIGNSSVCSAKQASSYSVVLAEVEQHQQHEQGRQQRRCGAYGHARRPQEVRTTL